MAGIAVAESSGPKKGKAVLAHLEIHPKMGGGTIVKHIYTGYQHDNKEVQFNEAGKSQGGEHVVAHLIKHAGLPSVGGGTEASEAEGEEKD